MKKPLFEHAMTYQKKLKNQMIHCLEIIEYIYIYIYIYDQTIEKYKRKMSYIQKNNP